MKCRLLYDFDCDELTMPPNEQHLLSFRVERGKTIRYFPKGTIRDCKWSVEWCLRGMAEPADTECLLGTGLTDQELKVQQHKYGRMAAGIHPDDFDLYDRGVISGYEEVDGQTAYLPGPNYAAWKAEQDSKKPKEEDI